MKTREYLRLLWQGAKSDPIHGFALLLMLTYSATAYVAIVAAAINPELVLKAFR